MPEVHGLATGEITNRGRGRGEGNRGGLGKYLRARGRGRGLGRPAEFVQRLAFDDEVEGELDEEEIAEQAAKYSKRQLASNADRYVEPEPELGSDGEPMLEPEVDLSSFLERQKLSDDGPSTTNSIGNDEDIDFTLSHIGSRSLAASSKKGEVKSIEWNQELEEMSLEKASAEATWALKSRFRAKSEKLRGKPITIPRRKPAAPECVDAPALQVTNESAPQKPAKDEMQDFLDDLLG